MRYTKNKSGYSLDNGQSFGIYGFFYKTASQYYFLVLRSATTARYSKTRIIRTIPRQARPVVTKN